MNQYAGKIVIIILSTEKSTNGMTEPDLDDIKGKKEVKEPKWAEFLSTDTSLHASSINQKYNRLDDGFDSYIEIIGSQLTYIQAFKGCET